MVFEGDEISWAELSRKVKSLSGFFSEHLGNTEQQVVSLVITNSIEFVVIYLAILEAGHIAMPLDPAYKRLEIDAIINQVPPAMIILQQRYADQVGDHSAAKYIASELLSKEWSPASNLRLDPGKQIASLTFTSGSSGKPKAVPNTHSNHVWNIITCSKVWDWTPNDSLLINLPLSHMHGLVMGLSGALYHGNTLYLRQQSFDAAAVLEELSSGKISLFTHGPIAYAKMLEQSGRYDLSKVRLFISGSAPLPPKLWQDFKAKFGVEVVETYGSTETGRIAANTLAKKRLGSAGQVLPGVDLKLSAEHEVLIKSGGVFPGYWNNPAATRQAMTTEGYWRTGDIGELKDGYLFLKGRTKERIRKFGYTVSPRDIEWALLENPKIKEVFVMGRQTPSNADDNIYYFIVGNLSKPEILAYCRANLPFSWRPDHIQLVKELPRTKNGKPHVKRLKEMAGAS